jgi:hypothetical protein
MVRSTPFARPHLPHTGTMDEQEYRERLVHDAADGAVKA